MSTIELLGDYFEEGRTLISDDTQPRPRKYERTKENKHLYHHYWSSEYKNITLYRLN